MPIRDSIDQHVARWKREVKGLDPAVEGAVVRMQVLVRHIYLIKDQGVAAHGLKGFEYDILAHLRSIGPPFQASPTLIAERTGTHPATLTNRLDRLEQSGYISRADDPDDGRRLLVILTPQAHQLLDTYAEENVAAEKDLLSALNRTERKQLSDLLRKIIMKMEADSLD